MLRLSWLPVAAALVLSACGSSPDVKEHELSGVIVAIDEERGQVTIRHGEIPGFMMAMTMAFPVQEAALLEGKEPGDLVTATLVVEETDGQISSYYLTELTRTGHVELEETTPGARIPDIALPGDSVPDTVLVNERGEPFTLPALRGHRVVVTFMYTRCPFPDFCPLMDRHFSALQDAIAADDALADVRLVSVTLDPEFDTPAVLSDHARRLGADPGVWSFVTGERDAIAAFSERFGIHAEQNGPSPIDMIHNLRTAVIDRDGRLATVQSGNMWTPADVIADLAALSAARLP